MPIVMLFNPCSVNYLHLESIVPFYLPTWITRVVRDTDFDGTSLIIYLTSLYKVQSIDRFLLCPQPD